MLLSFKKVSQTEVQTKPIESTSLVKDNIVDDGCNENDAGEDEDNIDDDDDDDDDEIEISMANVANEIEKSKDNDISEEEFQGDDETYPTTPLKTDEEWKEFEAPYRRKQNQVTTGQSQTNVENLLYLGQTFKTCEDFKEAMFEYVLKSQFDVKWSRCDRGERPRYAAVCRTGGCPWRIYCSVEKPINMWMIKVCHPHHSHPANGYSGMITMRHLGKMYVEVFRNLPSYKASQMEHDLKVGYNLTVSTYKCFKARQIALQIVKEDQRVQFAKLWDYEAEIRRSNPNTSTEIVRATFKGEKVFDRFYICFQVLRDTWKQYCRPVIGLDGCFLKWDLKGELLAAIGRDANDHIYPIAWAVVRIEDKDTWAWFIRKIKSDLGLGDGQNLTLLSDKQKGLINAVKYELPCAEHRMCARHMYANWKKNFKGPDLKDIFWKTVYSYHQGQYKNAMEEMKTINPLAYGAMLRTNPEIWCRAFFNKDSHCEDVHNNHSESFNNSIKEARKKPMIDMLEDIRRQTMKRIAKMSKVSGKCITEFTPRTMIELEKSRNQSRFCFVTPSGRGIYEVMEFGISYSVDLSGHSCACRKWDLTGVPCQHSLAVINFKKDKLSGYISEYFLTSRWVAMYENNILPVNGQPLWQKVDKPLIGVPDKRKMPGRPKKHNRKKDPHESPSKSGKLSKHGRVFTCGRCKQVGHTKKSCKNDPVDAPCGPKRLRGRPKISVTVSGTSNPTQSSQNSVSHLCLIPRNTNSSRPSQTYVSPFTSRPFKAPRRQPTSSLPN
ncbi:PREDICTED: uncharacterized protein LOC104826793 [Tarenaya hassleriana]|uniref:uncharacterized protein LOC104826793 n=1 Tax=Tarenaya hassleriana TaxID=28532 RepID=UPI00053C9A17|nr:PREDICTED: uncharacterized protein LOC104826793 [Tarenaya hassleriana]